MMKPVHRVNGSAADPIAGHVRFNPAKASWTLGMIGAALLFAPFSFSFEAFLVFLTLTYLSLLIGHSAGLHRMMIHRTYECHPAVEKVLIYIGVLVGMAGPFGVIRIHDVRDWAQRQAICHDFFSHRRPFLKDLWWQLTSTFEFEHPPEINIESKFADSFFYRFLERTWRLHQLMLATLLFAWGGWSFVVWGIFVRISVSIVGHWSITYVCHNPGPGRWLVQDAGVQASNIPGLGILTYGECWHNNHHAFPESARIGLGKGQSDPAYAFIRLLEMVGAARNIGRPRPEGERDDLIRRDASTETAVDALSRRLEATNSLRVSSPI